MTIVETNPEGKRPLRRRRQKWEANIRMDLREIGWRGVDWIQVAQNRDQWQALMDTELNLWFPLKSGNFLTSYMTISFSRRTPWS
jgi:hypothetical protein